MLTNKIDNMRVGRKIDGTSDADVGDVSLFCSSSPKPWVAGPPLCFSASLLIHKYPSISCLSLSSCTPLTLPSPPILIMQLFSLSLGGGLPWTNIVPYAGCSGGPYCVWRNGELTPMSELSQWLHCVWIFLRLAGLLPLLLPLYDENTHITANLNSLANYPMTGYNCVNSFPGEHTELSLSVAKFDRN